MGMKREGREEAVKGEGPAGRSGVRAGGHNRFRVGASELLSYWPRAPLVSACGHYSACPNSEVRHSLPTITIFPIDCPSLPVCRGQYSCQLLGWDTAQGAQPAA